MFRPPHVRLFALQGSVLCMAALAAVTCSVDSRQVTVADGGDAPGSSSGGASGGGSGGNSATGGASGSGGVSVPTGSGGGSGSGGATADAGKDAPVTTDGGGTGGSGVMLTGNGCAGGACLNPTCKALTTAAAPGAFPEIGFELRPTYIPNDVIIPTFDDVPDPVHKPTDGVAFTNFGAGNWTKQMVEYFDSKGMHVDFFINTNNFCDVAMDPDCVKTLTSILTNHNPANHTIHHSHMGGTTAFDPADYAASSCGFAANSMIKCDDEMKGVETVVNMLSGGGRPHLTRFRTPYGEPFQVGAAAAGYAEMRTLSAKYAVHIGWQMDSADSSCDDCKFTGAQIAKNVETLVGNAPGAGQWGLVLMHGTYPWTYDAVKLLLDPATGYFKMHNFRIGTVEDAICWKYGKHSWELVGQGRTAN